MDTRRFSTLELVAMAYEGECFIGGLFLFAGMAAAFWGIVAGFFLAGVFVASHYLGYYAGAVNVLASLEENKKQGTDVPESN